MDISWVSAMAFVLFLMVFLWCHLATPKCVDSGLLSPFSYSLFVYVPEHLLFHASTESTCGLRLVKEVYVVASMSYVYQVLFYSLGRILYVIMAGLHGGWGPAQCFPSGRTRLNGRKITLLELVQNLHHPPFSFQGYATCV